MHPDVLSQAQISSAAARHHAIASLRDWQAYAQAAAKAAAQPAAAPAQAPAPAPRALKRLRKAGQADVGAVSGDGASGAAPDKAAQGAAASAAVKLEPEADATADTAMADAPALVVLGEQSSPADAAMPAAAGATQPAEALPADPGDPSSEVGTPAPALAPEQPLQATVALPPQVRYPVLAMHLCFVSAHCCRRQE